MEFKFGGIVGNVAVPHNTGIRDIQVRFYGETAVATVMSGRDGGLTALGLSEGRMASVMDTRSFTSDMGALSGDAFVALSSLGRDVIVTGTDTAGTMQGYVFSAETGFGGQVRLDGMAGVDPAGAGAAWSTSGRLYMAGGNGDLIYSLRPDGQGGYRQAGVHDGSADGVRDIAAMATTTVAGQEYLLALSDYSDGLASYAIANNGSLTVRGTMGADKGLGLLGHPVGMEVATIGGATYVIVASASASGQGGALSVMELAPGGQLTPADHILDNLNTRFGNVQDIAIATRGDQVFVVVGGGDDGISLFTLLPGGTLVHLETLAHDTGTGLENIASIALAVLGDELQVLVASQNSPGVSQFSVSLAGRDSVFQAGDRGATLNGSDGHDVIVGGAGDDRLYGGAGDDIIVDGAGDDHLAGGAGADLFVMSADDTRDRIIDFDPGADRLDLSGFAMLYDVNALQIEARGPGVRVQWRDERIDITGAQGVRLTADAVRAAIVLGADRPPMIFDLETRGTPQGDVLEGFWGDDVMVALRGADILRGEGGDDRLVGNEGYDTLIGGDGDDTVLGGYGRDRADLGPGDDLYRDTGQGGKHAADTVSGGDGDDTIWTGGGADVLRGDAGDDRLAGGAGGDDLRGGDGNDTLLGQTQDDLLLGGKGNDVLHGNGGADTLYGGAGDDTVVGGIHDDILFGEGGDDLMVGGPGRDRIDMGAGRDLFLDMNEGGRAGSDTVMGGAGDDTFQGGGGGDLMFGDRGDDLILGRDGDDRLFGGDGDDIILGGRGADRVNGGNGRDRIFMNAGNDTWFDTLETGREGSDFAAGGNGADTFYLKGGNDTVFGGAGADVFVFAPGGERDTIMDFRQGTDTLRLDDALWSGDLNPVEVVARFADRRDGAIVLDFGDDEIRLDNIAYLNNLAADIDIF